jgi:predicted RNase H-like HicB family nuclease
MNEWSHLTGRRRRDERWLRRGIVFRAIDDAGGKVDEAEYERIVLAAGYRDARSVNRFFVGEPEPVLRRSGRSIALTSRGRSGSEDFTTHWLPRLLAGEVAWPTSAASALILGPSRESTARSSGTRRFTAAVSHEPPWYVARCLEVEVTSQGRTLDDALANLKEALELYFEDAPAPAPLNAPIIASVEVAA